MKQPPTHVPKPAVSALDVGALVREKGEVEGVRPLAPPAEEPPLGILASLALLPPEDRLAHDVRGDARRHDVGAGAHALGEHKPGRIKPGRIKRAALSLQTKLLYVCLLIRPRLYASECHNFNSNILIITIS